MDAIDKHEYAVRTWLTDDFKVIQEMGDPTGEMVRRVADVAAAQADVKFREGLIALGWVPPEDAKNMDDIDRVLATVEDAVRTQLIALGWAPPEEAKNMVDINRVLAMMGAGATLQELCDWLEELKR